MSQSTTQRLQRLAAECIKAGKYYQANLYLIAYALSPAIECGICSNSQNQATMEGK